MLLSVIENSSSSNLVIIPRRSGDEAVVVAQPNPVSGGGCSSRGAFAGSDKRRRGRQEPEHWVLVFKRDEPNLMNAMTGAGEGDLKVVGRNRGR